MPTSLPHVTVKRDPGGWVATCDRCPWTQPFPSRPGADLCAHEHRQKCRVGEKEGD